MAQDGFIRLHRCPRDGIQAVEADTAFAFARHTHEQFGIGVIVRGAQRSLSGRRVVEAGAGDLITVNPGEVHDGRPIGEGGRRWCMVYLDAAIVLAAAADIAQGQDARPGEIAPEFSQAAITHQRLARIFGTFFASLTAGPADPALADESLLLLLGSLLQARAPDSRGVPGGIARARRMVDEDPATPHTLEALAREAGLGPYQFLRAFARATGLTPHAYLMQRRIQLARRLIGAGMGLAQVAAAGGFADQSHMTRLFVRNFGMAPGAYAKAMA